jgi:hypothetical protein
MLTTMSKPTEDPRLFTTPAAHASDAPHADAAVEAAPTTVNEREPEHLDADAVFASFCGETEEDKRTLIFFF